MSIPLRILRKQAQERHPRSALSGREMDREAMILNNARAIFTEFPWNAVSFAALADICRITPTTLKKHFADIPAVMERLIMDHLMEIARAVGAIRWDTPERPRRCREAYIQATRDHFGGPLSIHEMMLKFLPTLPEDVRVPLQEIRQGIAESLTGSEGVRPAAILCLADIPDLTADALESCIAAIAREAATQSPPQPQPSPLPLVEPGPRPQPHPHHHGAKIRPDKIRLLQPSEPPEAEDPPTPRAGPLPLRPLLHKSG